MKKLLLLATVMLTFVATASAQSVMYPKFHLGVRGGLTVNTPTISDASIDGMVMAYGGIATDFRIAPIPLYIETGVYYMDKGGSITYPWGKHDFDNHFIHIPILVSYHFYLNDNMAVQPFVGFAGGYLTESEDFGGAVRFGCGYNFKRFYANIGYDIGVTENHSIKDNTFFVTFGYNFAGGR